MTNSRLKQDQCIHASSSLRLALVGISLVLLPLMSASAKTLATIDVPSGRELFREDCAQCHGDTVPATGRWLRFSTIAPADLTADHQARQRKISC